MNETLRTVGQGLLLFLVIAVVVADTAMDVKGMVAMVDVNMSSMLIVLLVAVVATAAQAVMSKIFSFATETPVGTVASIPREIDESILSRWDMVWDACEIDPDESRAEITEFPELLAQIERLEAARLMSTDRAVRVRLGAQVLQCMHETLDPLAAELRYLKEQQLRVDRLIAKEENSRQFARDATAELVVATPLL